MKKIISCLLAFSFMFAVCGISSTAKTDNVFYYDNAEIVVENADLSYEKKQLIADHIAGVCAESTSEQESSTYNLLCIFGHKETSSMVTEVRHNVYDTTPKCVQNIYKVTTCERENCDLFESEVISSKRISTCHG